MVIMANTNAAHRREAGYGHWRWQRLSAVLTLVLMVYFTYMVVQMGAMDYATARNFVAVPMHALALAFLVTIGFYHAALGVQVIVEDYIALNQGRVALIMLLRSLFVVLACLSLGAIASIVQII
jgi:succinate dehydrogenase / fumarate reductase membrane anchor subunit